MPQWKIDLIQRKKKIQTTIGSGNHSITISGTSNNLFGNHRSHFNAGECHFICFIFVTNFIIFYLTI